MCPGTAGGNERGREIEIETGIETETGSAIHASGTEIGIGNESGIEGRIIGLHPRMEIRGGLDAETM